MALHADSITVLSLCTGGGGLDLGIELAIPDARPVCYVEGEAFAVAHLVEAMREGCLADAPVWGDVRTFDGRRWRGAVDLVTGGYPCQPFSSAGKRRGEDDPRHLWPSIRRILAEVEPSLVFFENVAGHLTLGFDAVRADLRRLGFRVAAGLFTAEEVGAPHRRERLFILGVADAGSQAGRRIGDGRGDQQPECSEGSGRVGGCVGDPGRPGDERRDDTGGRDEAVADPTHDHRRRGERGAEAGAGLADAQRQRGREDAAQPAGGRPDADGDHRGMADPRSPRPQGQPPAGPEAGAVGQGGRAEVGDAALDSAARQRERRDELFGEAGAIPLFPPGPGDLDAWHRILEARPDLAPATQPGVRGIPHGMAPRLDRLRMLGNGVVPLQAAYAFVSLWACLHRSNQ